MPKISEATVAAHRAAQHQAILDAAETLIVQSGGTVPTLAAVGKQVGLARSSMYQYAKSREDLLAQLLVLAMERWTRNLTDALHHSAPNEQITTYIREALDLFTAGSHGPLMSAAQQFPETFADPEVQRAHNAINPLLERVFHSADPHALELLNAAIQRGAELIAHAGASRETVEATLKKMAATLAAT